jgi:hypothetical protein
MIGKIARFGSSFLGAIQYVYFGMKPNRTRDLTSLRGELVFAQRTNLMLLPDSRLKNGLTHRLNVEAIAAAMQTTAALNSRLRKPVWHQSFAFPPREQPSAMTLAAICEAFVGTFGFAQNQVVAFRHRDKQHDHIHIIANRVDHRGQTTALDSHNYRRTAAFCRLMEVRHQLMLTPHLTSEQLDGKYPASATRTTTDGPERTQLLAAIEAARQEATDISTFVEQLRQRGYVAVSSERTGSTGKRRGGLVYGKQFAGGTDRWIKASALGATYTYRSLQAFFQQKQALAERLAGAAPTTGTRAGQIEQPTLSADEKLPQMEPNAARLRPIG